VKNVIKISTSSLQVARLSHQSFKEVCSKCLNDDDDDDDDDDGDDNACYIKKNARESRECVSKADRTCRATAVRLGS
jgi:hypothetical protein